MIPTTNPPTIFPRNSPRPCPICDNSGIPLSRNSCILGKYVTSAPSEAIIVPIDNINAESAAIPINAPAPNVPAAPNITQHPDSVKSNTDKDAAVSRDGLILKYDSTPIIVAKPAVTSVRTPSAI